MLLHLAKKTVAFARRVKTKLIDFYFLQIPVLFRDKSRVIVIRIDAIGDYMLFRNFLHEMKQSEKYKNKKICLVGNTVWKDFAEKYDTSVIDTFIWFNTNIYKKKCRFLHKIRSLKAAEIINPIHSRTPVDDEMVKYSRAQIRIGSAGDNSRMKPTVKAKWDKIYNRLIPALPVSEFEFLRNKYFFENLLEKSIALRKPHIEIQNRLESSGSIVLFPGANVEYRQWPPRYFSELIDVLTQKYNHDFVICGGPTDKHIAEQIVATVKDSKKVKNFAGTTSLAGLAEIIKQARLLISNETGAVHMAVALDIPTVCISNGNHFGRFNPYPQHVFDKVYTVYPDDSFYDKKNYLEYSERFRFKSEIDIKTITVSRVAGVVEQALVNSDQ